MAIGNIGIGNTSTLAPFNKCFGFTKMDAGEIERMKKVAFGLGAGARGLV